ncbi:endonuclease IV [Candidatus Pacearchaeota archaeon ex4484_71]|nr:MAG: endonuclease IV [Candidatus Pacearchaeota archaeon ex4484_71]
MENKRIKFGPAGLGPVKDAIKNLENLKKLGMRACEISFTYGVYIKEDDAKKIGETAKKLGIQLSIHAPYWINLNSAEIEKVEKSKKRIIECLRIGTFLGARYVVFHPAFYGKFSKEETYENTKKEIIELEEIRRKEKYTPLLAPETMGKINVFGSTQEIARLVRDTGCHACIDFAHILARSGGDYKFKETFDLFKEFKEFHIHFSGIEFGDKGEKNHLPTPASEWKKLLRNIPKNKNVVVINESPSMLEDSIEGLKICKALSESNSLPVKTPC